MKNRLFGKIRARLESGGRLGTAAVLAAAALGCLVMIGWLTTTHWDNIFYLFVGFAGVLLLSVLALRIAAQRGRNPFTPLICLCIAVFVVCFSAGRSLSVERYYAENEPINQYVSVLQDRLNDMEQSDESAPYDDIEFMNPAWHIGGVDSNLILTDADGRVLHMANTWQAGGLREGDTMHALICPSRNSDGSGLMLLTDERGNVLSVFLTDGSGLEENGSARALTIPAGDEETADAAGDPLMERYFPSFGPAIDANALKLADIPALTLQDREGEYGRISLYDWHGETVSEWLPYRSSGVEAELNTLTDAQRDRLKEYLAWLESAVRAAMDGEYALRARSLASGSGQYRAYLLYENNSEVLTPVRQQWIRRNSRGNTLQSFGMCMIPATIVFLAFWVFVDAKKRGHGRPAMWAVLTLIGNVVAWVIYLITRPSLTVDASGHAAPRGACPICGTKLKGEYVACPGCGILLRSRCKNCGRALENDWSFCPYCTSQITRELPAANAQEQQPDATAAE